MTTNSNTRAFTRRQFLKTSSLAVVAGTVARESIAQAGVSPGEILRIGLIGCGGRGARAAPQALAAGPNGKVTAMGEALADRLQGSLETLKKKAGVGQKNKEA